ncbi:MAG: ATPase [Firmicutes bacterium HGW-Firmicutes-12]|nr:MAG: ATPase [Firmicutes bacterium HGW-Firmicutes-12]
MDKNRWYSMSVQEVSADLIVEKENGLNAHEAQRRLALVGYNRLTETKKVSLLAIFFSQFADFMVLVLIAAAIVSALLGEYADAATILAIIVINSALGFVQEYRAERSLEALKKMIAPEARVIRDKQILNIPAEELIPGDIVLLETGDIIPADLRMIEASQLEVSEATLTGESVPVKKRPQEIYTEETSLGDRRNMGYMGTVVTRGKGSGIVVETGMHTEMGLIAGYIQQVKDEDTPLQKRLAQLGRWLVFICLVIVAIVSVAGVLRGEPVYTMILTGVSLAVAAIPEGLPAIVTVALAIGVQKMVKRQAIVRELPAVETLGCATVICSDKTGTLTQNEMTVRKFYLAGSMVGVSGEGYEPHGKFIFDKDEKNTRNLLKEALKTAALCNNAVLKKNNIPLGGLFRKNDGNNWQISGDPTEGALLVSAAKAGIWREEYDKRENRILEIPFDSERKRMSVVYEAIDGKKRTVFCKGAPDVILNFCNRIYWEGEVLALTDELKAKVLFGNESMASEALRVLGLAYREIPESIDLEDESAIEDNLIFISLAGMIDPPRVSAKKAVGTCRMAGIKTVMITGDHKLTAEAVAKELSILTDPSQLVLTGQELDKMSDYQMKDIINQTVVYARVSPKHKLRIVKLMKESGHIVAMTGDGVNDAPAVKEADIGVSMGIMGTDVTKEASSLILGNDDFATIVAAIEEGRIIYDNIRKFIRYLLSCNAGEVLTMFIATLLGLPLPLLPIQILWTNLVTDGLPAIALGLDPGDPDVMQRRPRSPKESIFAHGLPRRIIVRGTIISIAVLSIYIIGFFAGGKNLDLARTMAFTALVFIQLFYVFDCRSERYSIFELGIATNKYLLGAVLASILMQLMVIYLPFFQKTFNTIPLELWHWILIITVSIGTTLLQGLYRAVKIRRKRKLTFL